MVRLFVSEGWQSVGGKGSHEKFVCPGRVHSFVLVTGHRMVSIGVVRRAREAIISCECRGDRE